MHKKTNFKFKKAVFETRLYFVVIAALFMLFFSLASHAFDHANPFELEDTCSTENAIAETKVLKNPVFKKGYNAVYRFINDHEYLFVPLSGAIAGEIRCGAWCAAAGGALGAIDEALIYFGVTDKHYLTWGVFGIATGHVIKPSVASDMAGVAESFHVVGVIPMEMGKEADINICRIKTQLAHRIGAIRAAALVAIMMPLGGSNLIWQAGIDHDLVLAGIDQITDHRNGRISAGITFPEQVGAMIDFNPAGIDRIDARLFNSH